jgi:AraC-like DNA-binding protein
VAPVSPVEPVIASLSLSVLSAALQRFAPDWRPPERQPPYYTLLTCTEGSAALVVDGQPTPLPPGALVLLPPGATLGRQAPLAVFTAYVIDFSATLDGLLDVPAVCGLPVALRPGAFRGPKLLEAARFVVRHVATPTPGYELAVHAQCVRLLDLIRREALEQRGNHNLLERTGTYRSAVGWLALVCKAIEDRSATRITLAELAEIANLHPAYFSTLFKKVTGVSPLKFVMQRRLQRARELLLQTDQPVRGIAALTGFYDAAHLTRVFHRAEGVSPGHFRRSNRPVTTGETRDPR